MDSLSTNRQAATSATIRETEVWTLHSDIVGEHYKIHVKLPFDYKPGDDRYPVVYAVDADRGFPLVANLAQFLEFPGAHIERCFVVAIGYERLGDFADFAAWRTRDLTPTRSEKVEQYWQEFVAERFGRSVTVASGGAETFYAFIERELVPFIDATYRT